MTYSEKLKDPRWTDLRERFKRSKRRDGFPDQCDDCGEDTRGPLHVHHRLYRNGAEPWEYAFDELRLICEECHNLIHRTEAKARAFVLTLEPHVCYEMDDFLEEIIHLRDDMQIKVAFARAKNVVRDIRYKNQSAGLRETLH